MKTKNIVDNSTNRREFNRAYKAHLEKTGKIYCSYCGYHSNENGKGRGYYGGFIYDDMETCRGKRKGTNTKIPNWKLVSKNPKQWMLKPIKIKYDYGWRNNRTYITIKW